MEERGRDALSGVGLRGRRLRSCACQPLKEIQVSWCSLLRGKDIPKGPWCGVLRGAPGGRGCVGLCRWGGQLVKGMRRGAQCCWWLVKHMLLSTCCWRLVKGLGLDE